MNPRVMTSDKAALFALSLVAARADAQPSRPANADAVVVVRVEAVAETPLCGVLFSSPVARHTVLRVEHGSVAPGPLYAFYECGWVSGTSPRVAPGMLLRLSLSRRPTRNYGSTVDGMGDPAAPRFYVVRGEVVSAP